MNRSGSSEWQVIFQVKPGRFDALRAQQHGNLCRVSHLVNHHVPQQAIHRVPLLGCVVHHDNPFQLAVCQRAEVGEDALLDNAPVVQQRLESETSIDGAQSALFQAGMVSRTGCWCRMSS